MDENYSILSVQKELKNLLSKYEILAVPLYVLFGLVRVQNSNGKHSRTVLHVFNGEPDIDVCISAMNVQKILLSI